MRRNRAAGAVRIVETDRAVKANFPAEMIGEFAAFIATKGFGIHVTPTLWPPKWGKAGRGDAGGCKGQVNSATATRCT